MSIIEAFSLIIIRKMSEWVFNKYLTNIGIRKENRQIKTTLRGIRIKRKRIFSANQLLNTYLQFTVNFGIQDSLDKSQIFSRSKHIRILQRNRSNCLAVNVLLLPIEI